MVHGSGSGEMANRKGEGAEPCQSDSERERGHEKKLVKNAGNMKYSSYLCMLLLYLWASYYINKVKGL